jgi:hypothetical protein
MKGQDRLQIGSMVKENLSGEEWQRQMTIEWVKRIKVESLDHAPVILDGQTRQPFIEGACRLEGISDWLSSISRRIGRRVASAMKRRLRWSAR